MEQKFSTHDHGINLHLLRQFCEREGVAVDYQKGDRLACEGQPARWFGFVAKGCFKYVVRDFSSGKEHITWFSFEGEFVGDYPNAIASFLNITPKTISMIRRGITFG